MEQPLHLLLPSVPGVTIAGLPAIIEGPGASSAAGLALTHGAAGHKDSPGLRALAAALVAVGHRVLRFDLPYRAQGKGSPPLAERSVPAVIALLEELGERYPGVWAAGGQSYGGRVVSLAVAEGAPAGGLVLLSYPLHAPGRPDRPRAEHWPRIKVPCLLVRGEADSFSNAEVLASHLGSFGGEVTLVPVPGGDHSLRVAARRSAEGRAASEGEVLTQLAPEVSAWLKGLV